MVINLKKEDGIDKTYYENLSKKAVEAIEEYVAFKDFVKE